MVKLNFSHRDVTRVLEGKLRLTFRSGRERNAWLCLDGKKVLRITMPHVHSASSVKSGTLNAIVSALRLSKAEFADLVRCPMTRANYESKVRRMMREGLI